MRMVCKHCGEQMLGDGYTTVLHCPDAEDYDSHEPDADPVYCQAYHDQIRSIAMTWRGGSETAMYEFAVNGIISDLYQFNKELRFCLPQDEIEFEELRQLKEFVNNLYSTASFSIEEDAIVAPWYNK